MNMINWKKEILTIPNLLSLFRLLLIPVYIILYLKAIKTNLAIDYIIAASVLAVSCLTDALDGQIARRFNQITRVGKILDPVADKLTQITLVVCLAVRYPVLWTLAILLAVKEFFQLIGLILLMRKGKMVNGALMIGKVCTTILFTSFVVLVLVPQLDPIIINIITVVDFVFTAMAFIQYIKIYTTNNPMVVDIITEEEK